MSGWIVTRGNERSLVYICVCVCVCVCAFFFGLRQNKEFSVDSRSLESTLLDAFTLPPESEYFSYTINKVKFTLEQATKANVGEEMYSSTLSLTSAVRGGWSTPRPGRFTPGTYPVPIV